MMLPLDSLTHRANTKDPKGIRSPWGLFFDAPGRTRTPSLLIQSKKVIPRLGSGSSKIPISHLAARSHSTSMRIKHAHMLAHYTNPYYNLVQRGYHFCKGKTQ